MKLFYKYLAKKFFYYFLTFLGIISLLIISSQMLNLPSILYHLDIFKFFQSILLINISFLKLQFLFAYALSFLFLGYYLRENREIYAIYSAGISKNNFLKFIIGLNIIAVVVGLFISLYVVPKANRERIKFITVNVKKYFLEALQPKNFTTLPGDYIVYVSDKDKEKMKNVVIYNQKNGFLITAKKAFFKGTNLILYEGMLQVPSKHGFNALIYKRYIFDLNIEYEKKYSIEDFRLKDLLTIAVSSNNSEKLKAIAVLSERIAYVLPFLFIPTMFFFIGLNISKDRDFILSVALGILVIYISINYYLIKLIEKGNISPIIYFILITFILLLITLYFYKKN